MENQEAKEKRAKSIKRKTANGSYGMFKVNPRNTKKHQIAELRRAEAGR